MPPETALNAVRDRIHNTDPKLVIDSLRTMSAQLDDALSTERIIALLAATFGVIATLLAAIGLYGVLAYVTTQRTREIGIRMALGARPWVVARLVLREVLLLTAASLVVAIPAALLLGRLLQSQLFNVSSGDFLTYAAGTAIVTTVALLSAAIPAHRAATVDPMQTLRAE
jgi:ABC-type antimicrobial peptide transport system permease subunit